MTSHEWQPSVFLNGDIAEKVAKLKQKKGPDLHVWGSGRSRRNQMKPIYIDPEHAYQIWLWFISSGGIAVWKSEIYPAASWYTRANETERPDWSAKSKPDYTITDLGLIIVRGEQDTPLSELDIWRQRHHAA
jgi:hypothetical protein